MTCGQGLWTKDWHNSLCALIIKKGAWETTTPTAAETSCKNHFSFIQKYYGCKMLTNYAGMKLLSAAKKKQYLVIESRPPCSFKTGHFTFFIGRERLENVLNWKMHAQNVQYCSFSSLNIQNCDLLVCLAALVTLLIKLLIVISAWATIEIWKLFSPQIVRPHGPQLI